MTQTTQTIRDQSVMVVECDIPAGLTIAEYKARRDRRASRPRHRHILRRWPARRSR